MFRFAPALLALVLASPAHALPVGYSFTSQGDPGSFSYDADTGIGTLKLFMSLPAGYQFSIAVPAVVSDGASEDSLVISGSVVFSPIPLDIYPDGTVLARLVLVGPELFTSEGALRSDLVWDVDVGTSLVKSAGGSTYSWHLLSLDPVPEPELGALVSAAVLLAAASRRLSRKRAGPSYGQ
jgi:hypothetical protein